MRTAGFRQRMRDRELMVGTFVKTPSHDVIEVLALSGLDFLCLDAEHAPFDRARLDACLAVAVALDVPTLVRVASAAPSDILQALDLGAVGVVVPHVDGPEAAAAVARAARFGAGGRGFAGSTRWAGFATRPMSGLLQRSAEETVAIAQIEDPGAVAASDAIAATDGIDGVLLGPADLSVALGETSTSSPALADAVAQVGRSAAGAGRTYATFVPDAGPVAELRRQGVSMFFVASEQAWMLQGARTAAAAVREAATG